MKKKFAYDICGHLVLSSRVESLLDQGWNYEFDSDVKLLLSNMTNPDLDLAIAFDLSVRDMKADGTWEIFDNLYIAAAEAGHLRLDD